MVNIDPVTGQRNPDVLRAVVDERESCLGVYGSVVEPGRIAVGDEIVVEERQPIPPQEAHPLGDRR